MTMTKVFSKGDVIKLPCTRLARPRMEGKRRQPYCWADSCRNRLKVSRRVACSDDCFEKVLDQLCLLIEGTFEDAKNDDPHSIRLTSALARAVEEHGGGRYGRRARETRRPGNVSSRGSIIIRRRTANASSG